MPDILAAAALLPDGWAEEVLITADGAGTITGVLPGMARAPAALRLPGAVIPGVPNLHSHAIQRALAGGAERRGPAGEDGLRTWQEAMLRLAARLDPEDVEAVAAMLHVELLEQGFTSLCEFHTLHHQPDGTPYAEPAEMALRQLAAARATGIGITLLPSLRRHGGIFGKPALPGQRRCLNDLDGLAAIIAACREATAGDPQAAIGVAPHSLGAVTPAMLLALAAMDGPIHIHAAATQGEVDECRRALHARPVEWLLDHAPVDRRWCVIHATRMTPPEIEDVAAAGAVIGLCPSTEASLGHGIFPLAAYLGHGGAFGIGTGSQLGTAPAAELRLLEFGQRLLLHTRPVAATEAMPHPARLLLDQVLRGGAQASGRPIGAIAPGLRCDLVELDPEVPSLVGRQGDALLDAWVFGPGRDAVRTVVVGGRCVVEAGRHRACAAIAAAYARSMRRVLA